MAEIIQRVWRSGPRKVKRTAWGFTAMINGKQARKTKATWSKQDAQAALAAALLEPAGNGGSVAPFRERSRRWSRSTCNTKPTPASARSGRIGGS